MGPTALTFYRAAKRLKTWGVPVLPGVVVAPGVEIGEGSFLSQNVSVEPRHGAAGVPQIGRNVFVGVGAQILGPVTVGDGAVIGANAVVMSNVAPGAVVAGTPGRELKRKAPATN